MDPRLALYRIWLERTRRRAARKLAAHPNCGIHRRDRTNVCDCLRKYYRGDNAGAVVL